MTVEIGLFNPGSIAQVYTSMMEGNTRSDIA